MNNSITIVGYVGQNPVIKTFDSGKRVANFSVAVKDYITSETTWFDIQAWNGFGDMVSKHVEKGREVVISGRLVFSKYVDKDSREVIKPVINLDGLHLCGSAPRKREEVSNDNQLANIS